MMTIMTYQMFSERSIIMLFPFQLVKTIQQSCGKPLNHCKIEFTVIMYTHIW